MADKTIGELPVASEVYDDSLLVMEQQGEARSVQGALIKKYAREATASYVEDAKKSAEEGKGYRDEAAESARDAADVALHPPILKDENDHWWIWDTDLNDYKDSGIDAGVSLDVVEEIVTGEPGTPASVANLGTKTDPRLQFTIPQGQKGDTGDAATIEIGEVTTGEPGTSASVKNSGTPGAAKLDFVIPQGPTGRGFTILGHYDSYDELDSSVPEPSVGDAYQVGTEKPYDVYIYDEKEGWVNSGPINVDLPPHLVVGEDSELGTVLPVDADTLEGHPAEYFVSDPELAEELEKKQDALPYYTNPNLLDNWYFVGGGSHLGSGKFPINQHRETNYSASEYEEKYSIDRWVIQSQTSSNITLEKDGLVFETSNSTGTVHLNGMYITMEDAFAEKTLTFSCLVAELTGTFSIQARNNKWNYYGTKTTTSAGLISLTFTVPANSENLLRLQIGVEDAKEAMSAKIIAAKLELGSQQTLAHKEGDTWVLNEIPNYAEELAKCQRYMQVIDACDYPTVAPFDAYTARLSYPLSQPMRKTPTLVADGDFVLMANGDFNGSVENRSIGFLTTPNDVNDQLVSISVTSKEGFPFKAGTPYLLFKIGKTAKIILDANL